MRLQDIDHFRYALTEEASSYLSAGSPEAQVFNIVPADGLPLPQLKVLHAHVATRTLLFDIAAR